MTTSRLFIAVTVLIALGGLFSIASLFHPQGPEPATSAVVATVDGRSITLRQVEQAVALPLYQANQQRRQLLQQAIQHLIDEELLSAEAARKGISLSRLLDEAAQSESIARLADLPAPVRRLTPGGRQKGPAHGTSQDLHEQARIRQALLVSLRRTAEVRVTLPEVEIPILPVGIDDDPGLGPDNAPVTIVEFSDFQCSYCRKSVGVLKELRRHYGDKIRLVYRDYPGQNHPHAVPAAEAAQCAKDQGKFWDYHDLLFDRQTAGAGWDYDALARELGLHAGEFSTCLSAGRYREEVVNDLQEGLTLGVTSTPTFFINGRPLVGARPVGDFTALIDPLLRRSSP